MWQLVFDSGSMLLLMKSCALSSESQTELVSSEAYFPPSFVQRNWHLVL